MNLTASSSEESLAERLRARIRREGAISFRDWMEAALYDEREGYYCRRDRKRWGRSGDYRTAPERSPLFAATFAGYFAGLFEELGAPQAWTIFEAGAGEGHFAEGVLKTLRGYHPKVFEATRYLIDERSGDAAARLRDKLKPFAERIEFQALATVSAAAGPGIVFANELLDAFPVHRVVVRGGKLKELFVGLNDAGGFAWVENEPRTPQLASYLERACVKLSESQTVEINLAVEDWIKRAAGLFHQGYLIIVDYGAEPPELYDARLRPMGSLRAFHEHRFADDVLARPGEQDLTTTIDWTNVKRAGEAAGLRTVSFERQDAFLLRAGLLERLEQQAREARDEAEALIIRSGARELILPGGMSESFQVLIQKK